MENRSQDRRREPTVKQGTWRTDALRVALPFFSFYALLLVSAHLSHHPAKPRVAVASTAMILSFGNDEEQIWLQAKDAQSNQIRMIQLQHTYQNAIEKQQGLETALAAAAKDHSQKRLECVQFWRQLVHEEKKSYEIIAAETDDSVFKHTNLPRHLM